MQQQLRRAVFILAASERDEEMKSPGFAERARSDPE